MASASSADPERDKKLDKLKKEVRSILQTAAKTGLSPEDLDRDYRDLNGHPMPLGDLGFQDVYQLLDSMPEVVEAYEVNGAIVLFAKSTRATAHLERLIAKAKPNRLGRFGGVINQPAVCRRGTPERRKLIEQRLVEVASRFTDYVNYFTLFNTYQELYMEALDARADFNCQPKALFTIKLAHLFKTKSKSGGSGQFAVQLKDEARKVHLETTADTAINRKAPAPVPTAVTAGEQRSMGSSRVLYSDQPRWVVPPIPMAYTGLPPPFPPPFPILLGPPAHSILFPGVSYLPPLRAGPAPASVLLPVTSTSVAPSIYHFPPLARRDEAAQSAASASPEQETIRPPNVPSLPPASELFGAEEENSERAEWPVPSVPPPSCTSQLREDCKKVLNRFPSGLPYFQFTKAYKEIIGQDLDLEPYNFLSVEELVDFLPDVFERTMEKGEVLLLGKETGEVGEEASGWTEDELMGELWRIGMSAPQRSICVFDIPRVYQQSTGRPFPVADAELDEFALKMFDYSDRFIFFYEGQVRFMARTDYEDASVVRRPCVPAVENEPYTRQRLPVTRQQLEAFDESDPARFLRVTMAQVYTPGQFYLHLLSTYPQLEKLVDELNQYLSNDAGAGDLSMASGDVRVGLACACRCEEDELWYRALVTRVTDYDHIQIILVDFGTEIEIGCDSIRRLPRQFFELPSQAIRAKLAVLSPIGQDWSTRSGERLAELCGSAELWAEVYKMDKDDTLEVFLTLTNERGEEVHVNDVLIGLGEATFNETELASDSLNAQLEDEIECPQADNNDEQEESVEDTLNTDPEETVVNELVRAWEEGDKDLDVFHLARTYFIRRRVAIRDVLTSSVDEGVIATAVDKMTWLEAKIEWLNRICV